MSLALGFRPTFPVALPSTPHADVALDRELQERQSQGGHYERDAFERSGKHSLGFAAVRPGSGTETTSVLATMANQEDDNHAQIAALQEVTSSVVRTAAPLAGLGGAALTANFLSKASSPTEVKE